MRAAAIREGEAVDGRFLPFTLDQCQLKDDAVANQVIKGTFTYRAVELSRGTGDYSERWICAVSAAGKVPQDALVPLPVAGGRELEYHAFGLAKAGPASSGCAVEIACLVKQQLSYGA